MPDNPLVTVPLTPDQAKKWQQDIKRADDRRKVFEPSWERNLKAYTPDPTNANWGDEVNPGVDFYQTEQKKALLFFDTPTVILEPEPDALAQQPQITAWQTKINKKLGRHDLDLKSVMDLALFDMICPAGVGCIKVGVHRITKPVPVTDPTTGQPQVDETGEPVLAPVPVYTKLFAERFSPKQLLIPAHFKSTQFDKAPWLGVKFTLPTREARRQFQIPDEVELKQAGNDANQQHFQLPGLRDDDSDEDEVTGTEVWYKAALYDDDVYHPEFMRQLVFIDGLDDPVIHRDSPYQTFENGAFTPDSMMGNPICPGTLRVLSDSAYVPSDSTMTRPLVNELSRFRTQLIELRDSSTSVRLANGDVITDELLQKTVRSPFGSILRVPGNQWNPAQPPVQEIAHPVYTRENFQSQQIIETDLSKVNTLSANQAGAQQETVRSATELSYIQRNSNVRMQAERNKVLAWFISIVKKIDALTKRYEPFKGQPVLDNYSYDIKPDSGVAVDAADDRKFFEQTYNMLAKDPLIDPVALRKELLPLVHLDPGMVKPPQPSGPPPPKSSLIVRGDDLNPLNPQYANVVQALNEMGIHVTQEPITGQMVQNAAVAKPIKPHGGTPPKPDLVSKHSADATGAIPHFGGQAGPA